MKINIILFEPEIAQNTGNIIRSCVAFNAKLHLIRPYGFFLNDKIVTRSSANYRNHLKLQEYNCFNDFLESNKNPNIFIYSRYGSKKPDSLKFKKDDEVFLMFGRESAGVDFNIIKNYRENLIRIPTTKNVRSINLANTVAIALYETIRQNKYEELEQIEPFKKDFWIKEI